MSDTAEVAAGTEHGPPRPTPRQTARLTLYLAALCIPAIWLGYSRLWIPRLQKTELWERGRMIFPEGWIAAGLCTLLGFGIAVLLAVAILNRHRARMMFRPTAGKLLATGAFAMLAPVGLFAAAPIGGWFVLLRLFNPIRLAESGRLLSTLGLSAALLFVAYGIVSMVLYGIRNYAVRGLLLVALWLSLYAAWVLFSGVDKSPL